MLIILGLLVDSTRFECAHALSACAPKGSPFLLPTAQTKQSVALPIEKCWSFVVAKIGGVLELLGFERIRHEEEVLVLLVDRKGHGAFDLKIRIRVELQIGPVLIHPLQDALAVLHELLHLGLLNSRVLLEGLANALGEALEPLLELGLVVEGELLQASGSLDIVHKFGIGAAILAIINSGDSFAALRHEGRAHTEKARNATILVLVRVRDHLVTSQTAVVHDHLLYLYEKCTADGACSGDTSTLMLFFA